MASALSAAYTATPLPAGAKLAIFATRPVSQGRYFMPASAYKLIKVGAAAGASPLAFLTEYVAKFGALVIGQKIFVRAIVISSDGMASVVADSSVVVS